MEAYPGHVTAVVGENGAGKSTLMKILAGVYHADSGDIFIDGNLVSIGNPHKAQELGISIIYQERNLVQKLSIAENLYLGSIPTRFSSLGWVDWNKLYTNTAETLSRLGMELSPKTKVINLSPAQQQMTEIAKSLTSKARILIMDEPTSALSDRETSKLFEVINRLKSEGVAVIFISHRIEEVFFISDFITILRDGSCVGKFSADELDQQKTIDLMVGRPLNNLYPRTMKPKEAEDDILLNIYALSSSELLRDIHFIVRKGEILGLGGLAGAGRTEIVRALFGVDRAEKCQMIIDGKEVKIRKPSDAIAQGIGFVTEERRKEGLLAISSINNNISLAVLKKLSHYLGWIKHKEEAKISNDFVDKLSIASSSIRQKVSNLSGGNQQKVILARWLAIEPKILILDEPTKGIDVGAKAEIHRIMDQLSQNGIAIILISSEMPELLAMCDRILVLNRGRIAAEYNRDEATQEKVLTSAIKQL